MTLDLLCQSSSRDDLNDHTRNVEIFRFQVVSHNETESSKRGHFSVVIYPHYLCTYKEEGLRVCVCGLFPP